MYKAVGAVTFLVFLFVCGVFYADAADIVWVVSLELCGIRHVPGQDRRFETGRDQSPEGLLSVC